MRNERAKMKAKGIGSFIVGCCLVLTAGAADVFESPEAAANAAMDRVMTALWDPGTGCVYDFIASNRLGEVSYKATMPTPEEVKLNFPNPNGWRMGMEDCPLKGGTMLAAALARLEAHGGNDDEARAVVEKVYKGLRNCATISGIPGFVARGVLPTDGKSFYINSSRDQYTLFVYLLWRYYRSGFADEARKAEIRQMLVDVAAHLKRCLEDPKCEMTLTRADGKPGDVGYMWVKDTRKERWEGSGLMCYFDGLMCPHEAFRPAMFFAAAWDVSGDAKWREEQLKYMPEAFYMTSPKYVPYGFDLPVFALFQAQVSQRLLWEVEPDPATKARLEDVLERFARMSESVQDEVERAWSKLTPEVFAQPADDWRAAKFIYRSGRPGGQPPGELISGLPYMIPLITGYWNKSFIGEALGAGLLCRMLSPRTPVPASEIERFNRLIVEVDWTKNIASAVSHTVYAYWAIRCGLHRRPSAPLKVALTFDDGLKDQVTVALPLLDKYGWKASFNIITDKVGADERHMSWDDVRRLAKEGHEIVTHTCSHPSLPKLLEDGKKDVFKHEIVDSAKKLEAETGRKVWHVCLPGNNGTPDVLHEIRMLGYEPQERNRPNLGGPFGAKEVGEYLDGQVRAGESRCALMMHAIVEGFGYRPFPNGGADLEAVLNLLKSRETSGQIRIVPYAEAYR